MADDSSLLAAHRALKIELGRSVFHALRRVAANGHPESARKVASLVRHVQQTWDEARDVSKVGAVPNIHPKWLKSIQARHERLDQLTRELDAVERSYEWSKVLFVREEEYIRDATLQAIGPAGDPGYVDLEQLLDPDQLPAYDEAAYLEDVTISARILAKLQEEEELTALRRAHVAERKKLREKLREAYQARTDSQIRREAELDRLYDWFKGSGFRISRGDMSVSASAEGKEDTGEARRQDGREVKQQGLSNTGWKPVRKNRLAPVTRVKGPRLETASRVRYYDSHELVELGKQLDPGEYFGRSNTGHPSGLKQGARTQRHQESQERPGAQASMDHAARMYGGPGSDAPSSAREPRSQRGPPGGDTMQGGPPLPPKAPSMRQRLMPPPAFHALGEEARHGARSLSPVSPVSPAAASSRSPLISPHSGSKLSPLDVQSDDLLLLNSSHRVVSEGARNGAFVFWLEPPEQPLGN